LLLPPICRRPRNVRPLVLAPAEGVQRRPRSPGRDRDDVALRDEEVLHDERVPVGADDLEPMKLRWRLLPDHMQRREVRRSV